MGRRQRFHCLCQASKNTFTTNSFLDTSADELYTSKEITLMKWNNYPEIRHLFSISLANNVETIVVFQYPNLCVVTERLLPNSDLGASSKSTGSLCTYRPDGVPESDARRRSSLTGASR